ncbi:hypothetical protein GW764_02370 [Candidatus Parcubacteria bacterium]|nr:hypothetical protein [Candidatus Parcubacteria bacterium]
MTDTTIPAVKENKFIDATNILDHNEPVSVKHNIPLKDLIFKLGPGFGYAKIFDELTPSSTDRKVIFHLIGHQVEGAESWPIVKEMEEFGASLGYRKTNIRELLYFCKDIREEHHQHHEIRNYDVVASGSEAQMTRNISGHYPMAPSAFSMSSFSKRAKCPPKVLLLMAEEV